MKYEDCRSSLKDGDIIGLSHQSWKTWADVESQVVKSVTQSEFSHVALIKVLDGIPFVVESVVPLVRMIPLDNLQEDFYLVQTNVPISKAEQNFLLSQIASGEYSKLQAIEAQFDLLDIGADRMWSCAEFLITARKLSGLNIKSKATPAAVIKWLLQNGHSLNFVIKV